MAFIFLYMLNSYLSLMLIMRFYNAFMGDFFAESCISV